MSIYKPFACFTHNSMSRSRQVSAGENLISAISLLDLTTILVLCRCDQAALVDNTGMI